MEEDDYHHYKKLVFLVALWRKGSCFYWHQCIPNFELKGGRFLLHVEKDMGMLKQKHMDDIGDVYVFLNIK